MVDERKKLILIAVLCLIPTLTGADDGPDSSELAGGGIIIVNGTVQTPYVQINSGTLRGFQNKTVGEGKTYYSFRGIPFAQPPVGDLRFRDPVPASNWSGIYDASYDRAECIQGNSVIIGSEDCLYINVYVPKVSGRNLSVMVWIYGGTFETGTSTYSQFGPDYLLEKEVVFVSFNYRLGVFGWLSTENLACPGNWGLKDQVLALKWVKENIQNFYGNPDHITVFGQSAGAVSISCLLESRQTTGLFNAAIMESGHSLNLWSRNVRARSIAFAIGVANGISTLDSSDLVERLRNVDFKQLQRNADIAAYAIFLTDGLKGLPFSPVLEPEHDTAVFTNLSYKSLLEGNFHHVPQIIGFNSDEASAVGYFTDLIKAYLNSYSVKPYDLAPYNLTMNWFNHLYAGLDVDGHYFNYLPPSLNVNNVLRFINEDQFFRPMREAQNLTAAYTNVYSYVFSHVGTLAGVKNRHFPGVGHSEELRYIFVRNNPASPADKLTRQRMVTLWTNFAKYYNPTPKVDPLFQNLTWPSVTSSRDGDGIKYLDINTTLSIDQDWEQQEWEYYSSLYKRYGGDPATFDTY